MFAEYRGNECHYAKCHFAECRGTVFLTIKVKVLFDKIGNGSLG